MYDSGRAALPATAVFSRGLPCLPSPFSPEDGLACHRRFQRRTVLLPGTAMAAVYFLASSAYLLIFMVLVFSNLTESEKSRLQAFNIDYVTLDPAGDPSPDNLSVQADNWTGGLIATRHLLSLGHTRIGIITGPNSMLCSKARLDGYKAALDEHDIPFDPDLVREGDFSTAGGYLQGLSLLKNSAKRPTAIFAGSDLQSMGVYEAARTLDLKIPEQLSVIGFDDVQTAAYMGPALTTVRQPLQDMAAAAVRMIIDKSHGGRPIQNRSIYPTTLIVRDSTRPLEISEPH